MDINNLDFTDQHGNIIIPKTKNEKQKEYFKNYYENNKEKFVEYNKKRSQLRFHCTNCDTQVLVKHRLRHSRTKKCLKNNIKT
jgi:hypothetical protein